MRIGIVGAGIGGLSLAVALLKNGFDVTVFEKAPSTSTVGAGIVLSFNGFEVIKRLQLASQVLARGKRLQCAAIVDRNFKNISRFDVTPLEDKLDGHMVAIERATLHGILLDALPKNVVHWGKEGVGFAQSEDQISVQFANHSWETFDLLVAADGLHSPLRHQLFPRSTPRYSGQTSWRAISHCRIDDTWRGCNWESWGDGVRFGMVELADGKTYWYAVAKAEQGGKEDPTMRRENILALFKNFHPVVRDVVQQTPTESILRTDISDLRPLENWCDGRLVLVGDAAHTATPNLGQGGNQALEDAWCLASLLSNEPLTGALKKFEQKRLAKANAIIRQSRFIGDVAHIKAQPWSALRNALLRRMSAKAQLKRVAALAAISE